jgi:UDP-N-acetylglucosamine 2-epimerase (non-hydrolysing)
VIHIFVGTKAQFIKMSPIIKELDIRGIEYNFIDAGQHAALTQKIVNQFALPSPHVVLRNQQNNISTIFEAVTWTISSIWKAIFNRKSIFQQVFFGKKGICLIHGDTLTTLLSLIYAKRCGLKIAHVEAGLRSFNIFNPFPEEIIRIIAMHSSDILFAPSDWAYQNLINMKLEEKAVNIQGNTIIDALDVVKGYTNSNYKPKEPYALVTVHRVETIFSRSRMNKLVGILQRAALDIKVVFVLHDPTRKQLERFGLFKSLDENSNIKMSPLLSYIDFINLMEGAVYVISDGGSIQEETAYLNVPCIILRSRTERREGLGKNSILSNFDLDEIFRFVQDLPDNSQIRTDNAQKPSRNIVDFIIGQESY